MDLLDSVLRAAGAEKYIQNFRSAKIDAKCLKLLVEKDLLMLGIEEPEVRENLLQRIKNLVIHVEKRVNVQVDQAFTEALLLQISKQLLQHHANLICAARRPDVVVCDVQLEKGTTALLKIISDFKAELRSLKQNMEKSEGTRKSVKTKVFVVSTAMLGIAACISFIIMRHPNA